MKSALFATLALAITAPAGADVLRYVDENGRTGFTDRAPVEASIRRVQPDSERFRVNADKLPGVWSARGLDGVNAELRITPSGSFVFDRRDETSPARLYMCGNWTSQGKLLSLDVRSLKQQFEDGAIEQQSEASTETFEVLSATRDLLVIRFAGRTFNFRRQVN